MAELLCEHEILRKALHESAHAAVAFRMEIPVEFVTIRPEIIDGRACKGFCAFSRKWNHDLAIDPEKWLNRFAKAMLAGRLSDELLLKEQVTEEIRGSWSGDSDILVTRVEDLRPSKTWQEFGQWRDRMLEETRQILVEPEVQAGIKAVAILLLQRERITGEEARAAFISASTSSESGTLQSIHASEK